MSFPDKIESSAIVVAHPDDEILWFSSILKKVDKIVLCYPDELADREFGARRKRLVDEYPLKNVSSLNLAAMGVWRPQSFVKPRFNKYGIEIVGRDVLYLADLKKYKENYHEMRDRLGDILSQYRNVFTHNPWGEYGHEEHVQVYRVISELKEKIGFEMWYSCYCSTRTVGLINPYAFMKDSMTLNTDIDTAKQLKNMYVEYGCWTWYKSYSWPVNESFVKEGNGSLADPQNGKLVNLHLIMLPLLSPENNSWCLRIFRRMRALLKVAVVSRIMQAFSKVFIATYRSTV